MSDNRPTNEQLLKLAKERVGLKKGLKWHFIVFALLSILLAVINYLTYEEPNGTMWAIWGIIGLGVPFVIHAICAFVKLSGQSDEQKVAAEYERLQRSADTK